MTSPRKLAAAGLAAGVLAGGAAGLILSAAGTTGAAPAQASEDTTTADAGPNHEQRLAEILAPLLEDGTLDQDQLDAVISTLSEAAPERRGGRGGPGHHRGGPGGFGVGDVAEELGVDTEAFRDAIRDGSTPAEAAQAQGVEPQALIDALVARATERIESRVAEGEMTGEEADERLAELTERITDMVHNGPGH